MHTVITSVSHMHPRGRNGYDIGIGPVSLGYREAHARYSGKATWSCCEVRPARGDWGMVIGDLEIGAGGKGGKGADVQGPAHETANNLGEKGGGALGGESRTFGHW